jgi:hypothetical protein
MTRYFRVALLAASVLAISMLVAGLPWGPS